DDGGGYAVADALPVGGQTAFGENDGERDEAELLSELGILEVDAADPGLADHQAQAEIDQQTGQAGTVNDPDGCDGRDDDDGGDEKPAVQTPHPLPVLIVPIYPYFAALSVIRWIVAFLAVLPAH